MSTFGTSTETGIDFAPLAKQGFDYESGVFNNLFQPQEMNAHQRLLSMLQQYMPTQARANSPAFAPVAQTLQLPAGIMQHAAGSTGVYSPQLMAAIQHLQSNAPQLLDLLRQAALSQAGQTTSITDPRYAKALMPVTTQDTTVGTGKTVLDAAGLAAQLASLYSQYSGG